MVMLQSPPWKFEISCGVECGLEAQYNFRWCRVVDGIDVDIVDDVGSGCSDGKAEYIF